VQVLVGIGFAAFFIASLTVGVRLLMLWWRTRQLPELLIGIGVLGIGPIGFGFAVIAEMIRQHQPAAAPPMFGISLLAVGIGAFSVFVFNWRVYHPNNKSVQWLVWIAGGGLAAAWLSDVALSGFHNPYDFTPQYLCRSLLQVGCLLWGSAEALRYGSKLRRRLRLGLADPVVVNRFFLWGIGAGAAGMGSLIGVSVQAMTGVPLFDVPWLMLSSSFHGLVAAIAMWLAFVPPARYLSRVRRLASEQPG